MNCFRKVSLAVVLCCIFLFPTHGFGQASISIDHVDGLYTGKIQPDIPVDFNISWTNNSGFTVDGGNPGYRVYLSNNIELPNGLFNPIILDTLPVGFSEMFDGWFSITYYSNDGVGSDTVDFGGYRIFGTGLSDGFNELVANIKTFVSSDFAGDSLCIDSSFNPPAGTWKWVSGSTDIIPDWSGPHCYEILPSCCVGLRGNFDNSPDDFLDISDLVQLVTYMFNDGNPPVCDKEADFNGDGTIDISDLVAMISYMHGGPLPASCPF